MSKRVISFHYTLTDAAGKVLDSSIGSAPLSFMEGVGQIIPGLESHLIALKKGDKRKIEVPAAVAYGSRDEEKVIKVPRIELPVKEVKVGDRFNGGEDGHGPIFIVTELSEADVTLDANHFLAGMDLTFDVELTDIREATQDELSHGHVHGEHGHSH